MIVSHQHRFIFLRTEKTAGSSLHQALAGFCGPGDVVTGNTHGRNAGPGWIRFVRHGAGTLRRQRPGTFGFHTHATLAQVRDAFGEEVVRSYFKFTIERNPWDRQVSLYCQRRGRRELSATESFRRDMESPLYRGLHYTRLDNWGIYTLNDRVAVDFVIRYEDLENGIREVLRAIGLAGSFTLPRKRSEWRVEKGSYREFYSDRVRDLVGRWYRREIEEFGYRF